MMDKPLARRTLLERLARDWQELADYFEVSNKDRAKFENGREVLQILDWLEQRERTGELEGALRALGRADLVGVVETLFSSEDLHRQSKALETKRGPLVQLNLTAWADLVKKRSRKLPDRLLNVVEFQDGEELFASLDSFVDLLCKAGLTVELSQDHDDRADVITDTQQMWIRLLAALIMGKTKRHLGSWRWFIGETVKQLGSGRVHSITNGVWDYILTIYCDRESAQYRATVLADVVSAVLSSTIEISSPAKRSSFLFSFINFMFSKLEHDAESIKEISTQLREYDESLGNSESPLFLERLKRLIGIGFNIAFHGAADAPPFTPKMARVDASELCNYAFEAMIHPLTVLEISSLKGIPVQHAGENAEYPYVFKAVSDKGEDIFNSFIGEIESIVSLAMEYEPHEQFDWDVPTISEWIVFSSCGHQPFPWGFDPLTPERANFDFGDRRSRSRLRPIGSYPLGASELGIQDCFGNVHEIVRASKTNRFPQDFRLAGGCYQTHASLAIPRFIRGFRSRQPETRRNIGLRLVRYDRSYSEKRFMCLRAYRERLSERSEQREK